MSTRERKLREAAATKLEENEWFGPAEDIRDGLSPAVVIRRVEQDADEDERERAIPILADLEHELEGL